MKLYFLIFIILVYLVNGEILSKNWTITQGYHNPDGIYTLVYLINGKFLEENIIANYGDWLDLTIYNKLQSETITMHMHGIDQKGTPYMDGVPYVTQYPIMPMQSYNYKVQLLQTGTYWIHNHETNLYSHGLFGALIIHDSNNIYDITHNNTIIQGEQILIINDWYHQSTYTQIAILKEKGYPWFFPPYTNVLWNGKGVFNCSKYSNINLQFETAGDKFNCNISQYHQIQIKSGILPLRLRIINASSGLTLIFSIDYHQLIIIAVDGVLVKPFTVQRILMYVGQRYDILIYPLQSEIKNFWIRTNTLDYPIGDTEQSLAILNYDTFNSIPNTIAWNLNSKNLSNLEKHLIPADNIPKIPLKDVINNMMEITLNINCSYTEYLCTINNIRYIPDSIPLILQQYNNLDITNPSVIKIPQGKYVKLIINSRDGRSHSFHKHGSNFWILGVGDDNAGYYHKQQLNTKNPIYRDTAQINGHSWMVLLFHANQVGLLLYHCHYQIHELPGMAVVFLIEGNLLSPPENYPILTTYTNSNNIKNLYINDSVSVAIYLGFIFLLFGGVLIYCIFKSKKYRTQYNRL